MTAGEHRAKAERILGQPPYASSELLLRGVLHALLAIEERLAAAGPAVAVPVTTEPASPRDVARRIERTAGRQRK